MHDAIYLWLERARREELLRQAAQARLAAAARRSGRRRRRFPRLPQALAPARPRRALNP